MSTKSAGPGRRKSSRTEKLQNVEKPSGRYERTSESKRRKVQKNYLKEWVADIAKNGFARCLFASCSFTSSDINVMQEHHKTCAEVFSGKTNSVEKCDKNLTTSQAHVDKPCEEKQKPKRKIENNFTEQSIKTWEEEIKTWGQACCENQGCSYVGFKISELKNHSRICTVASKLDLLHCNHCRCGFSNKQDLLKHEENCRFIKKPKDFIEDHIIQPGPVVPKDQYRRRRPFKAEHKNSWALALKRYKYVKCMYQNCHFLAMSLEDMIAHFGVCNGDGSFAKFVCPYCSGRVTSKAILLKHIERSHILEISSTKSEFLIDESSNEIPESECVASQTSTREELLNKIHQKVREISKAMQADCRKLWEKEISEFGYGFCRNSLCNFMSPYINKLEDHVENCDGTPNYELFNCRKCRHQLPTEDTLVSHELICDPEKTIFYYTYGSEMTVMRAPKKYVKSGNLDIRPVVCHPECESSKADEIRDQLDTSISELSENTVKESEEEEGKINEDGDSEVQNLKQKRRGKPKKSVEFINENEQVKCGKCDFEGRRKIFVTHNMKNHHGLGWVEGEQPIDFSDDKLVIRVLKEALKVNKKLTCEKCDESKKSAVGFWSHYQACGKSDEEINALKTPCPYCDGKYMKNSWSIHVKNCHLRPGREEEEEKKKKEMSGNSNGTADTTGKRLSALKAVSRFQQVLNDNYDNDEPESKSTNEQAPYFLYERGSEDVPKLNVRLNSLWYKLKRDKQKIPCRHPNCKYLSADVKEAKTHHYSCSFLPEKVYMCQVCDFYSVEESGIKSHITKHVKYKKAKKGEEAKLDEDFEESIKGNNVEDGEGVEMGEEEDSEDELDDLDETNKRRKKGDDIPRKKIKILSETVKLDSDTELRLKQNFCRRENIDNFRGIQFYSNGLNLTMQEEKSALERSETWPEFHTALEDWWEVPQAQAVQHFPELNKSVWVCFSGVENNWRKLERFHSDLIDGIPMMFTGGSVRSLSWCKISFNRMMKKSLKQYLAVTTARRVDHLNNLYERSALEKSTILQIWDCGVLENDRAKELPKLKLGLVLNGGEVLDLAWFPNDLYTEATNERLSRLGLLATASEDGIVRVWSICDPSQLKNMREPPVYKTHPVVILMLDNEVEESCFRLSVGSDGFVAGGYCNGTVAVWNLKNVSSPFCRTLGKSKIIRAHLVFQAHKTSVTAMTFCPLNSRYISTSGLDRLVKMWDLESPSVPIEQNMKDYSLDNIWPRNWPSIFHNFDEVMLNYNKGTVKFIKDIITEKRHSSFTMENPCLSLCFSDWLNALCGGSFTGEVKIRLLRNLLNDQKRIQSTISSVRMSGLTENDKKVGKGKAAANKDIPKNYDELIMKFGLVFKDNLGIDRGKPKKPEAHPENFPIRAINKVVFNPNFESFTHLAAGYHCGLIRIYQVRELQSTKSWKFFLEKIKQENK